MSDPTLNRVPFEGLNVHNLALEILQPFELRCDGFESKSTAQHDSVKVSSLLTLSIVQTNLPLGTFCISLDPLNGRIKLYISI